MDLSAERRREMKALLLELEKPAAAAARCVGTPLLFFFKPAPSHFMIGKLSSFKFSFI